MKRAEQKAAGLSERFESLIHTIRGPITMLDIQSRVTVANEPLCRLLGIRCEQTVGKPLVEIAGGRLDIPQIRKALDQVVQHGGNVADLEVSCELPQIGRRVLCVNATRLDHGDGAAGSVVVSLEDVTKPR